MNIPEFKKTAKEDQEDRELRALRAQKRIVAHADGYKIEGYFGKLHSYEEAERVVKLLEKQELLEDISVNVQDVEFDLNDDIND